jgi:hypothetical protein
LVLGRVQQRVVGGRVIDQPICALVLCAYATEPWSASLPMAGHGARSTKELQAC